MFEEYYALYTITDAGFTVVNPVVLSIVVFIGLEFLSILPNHIFANTKQIPIKGKHLDKFTDIDNRYILINKILTCIFVNHTQYIVHRVPCIIWSIEKITISNTLFSLIAFYIFYDLIYTLFHRALHHRSVYALIHKHHHRQKAPSRGNIYICYTLLYIQYTSSCMYKIYYSII